MTPKERESFGSPVCFQLWENLKPSILPLSPQPSNALRCRSLKPQRPPRIRDYSPVESPGERARRQRSEQRQTAPTDRLPYVSQCFVLTGYSFCPLCIQQLAQVAKGRLSLWLFSYALPFLTIFAPLRDRVACFQRVRGNFLM